MPIDPALKAKQNLYEDTVIHYMNKEDGHVIVLSDDQAFSTQLRLTLAKELGLSSPTCSRPCPTRISCCACCAK